MEFWSIDQKFPIVETSSRRFITTPYSPLSARPVIPLDTRSIQGRSFEANPRLSVCGLRLEGVVLASAGSDKDAMSHAPVSPSNETQHNGRCCLCFPRRRGRLQLRRALPRPRQLQGCVKMGKAQARGSMVVVAVRKSRVSPPARGEKSRAVRSTISRDVVSNR